MLDFTTAPVSTTVSVDATGPSATAGRTPAEAVAAAVRLAPRLLAQAAATDAEGLFPTQEISWLHEVGLLTAILPTALGGAALGEPAATLPLLHVLYHIGRGNLVVGRLLEGHYNALLLLRLFATPSQLGRYAADARAGLLFGVWNTENPAHGVRLLPGAAPGSYLLQGAKTFASGAGSVQRPLLTAELFAAPPAAIAAPVAQAAVAVSAALSASATAAPAALVLATPATLTPAAPATAAPATAAPASATLAASTVAILDKPVAAVPVSCGWQMLVLPADTQPPVLDRSFWQPLGMRASASYRADLTGLPVAAADLVGQPGDYYRQPWFGGGAARFVAVQLGGAAAVLDETRRFLRRQHRTDDPYQRQRLGELLALHETGQAWLRSAATQAALPVLPAPLPPARLAALTTYVNLLRSTAEGICLDTLRLAERCVGARGLLRPEPFERLHRDLTHYLRQPAPDAVVADAGQFALASDTPAFELFK